MISKRAEKSSLCRESTMVADEGVECLCKVNLYRGDYMIIHISPIYAHR